jgi:hypothetical protein
MIAPRREYSAQMTSISMNEEIAEVGLAKTDRPQRDRLQRKLGVGSTRTTASKVRTLPSSNAGASNEADRLSVEDKAGDVSEARLYLAAMTYFFFGFSGVAVMKRKERER